MFGLSTSELGRLVVLLVLGAYILAPVPAEILGYRPPSPVRTWRMYASVGADLCQVAYFARAQGQDRPVDRRRALGLQGEPRKTAIRREKDIAAQGARICATLHASDVRADARCGTRGRWRTTHAREENLCR
jgi:hypothetical protein